MAILRIGLTVFGILLILIGALWIGQGTGLFPYPATSFMINQSPWIWRGALLAVVGLALLWANRRMAR